MTDPERDFGETVKVVYDDFNNEAHRRALTGTGAEWTIKVSEGSRKYRIKMLMLRGTSEVKDLWISHLEDEVSTTVLHLDGAEAARFVGLIRNNAFEPEARSVDQSVGMTLPDASALAAAYEHDADALRLLIEKDATAADVVAIAHRKEVVEEFRKMLHDDAYFDLRVTQHGKTSKEGVWQDFFECNPWLLGLGLSSHLLVGWDEGKLEKVVTGADIGGPGKRADAVLKTAGVIGLLALGEIKHHRTDLLAKGSYRSGCWPPSSELAGAVAQSQGTVQLTIERLSSRVFSHDSEGFQLPSETTYLYRPRSYVIAGQLSEFIHPDHGGHDDGRIRSFEIYRRNLQEPVVLTFDELLARAEAVVAHQGK